MDCQTTLATFSMNCGRTEPTSLLVEPISTDLASLTKASSHTVMAPERGRLTPLIQTTTSPMAIQFQWRCAVACLTSPCTTTMEVSPALICKTPRSIQALTAVNSTEPLPLLSPATIKTRFTSATTTITNLSVVTATTPVPSFRV